MGFWKSLLGVLLVLFGIPMMFIGIGFIMIPIGLYLIYKSRKEAFVNAIAKGIAQAEEQKKAAARRA